MFRKAAYVLAFLVASTAACDKSIEKHAFDMSLGEKYITRYAERERYKNRTVWKLWPKGRHGLQYTFEQRDPTPGEESWSAHNISVTVSTIYGTTPPLDYVGAADTVAHLNQELAERGKQIIP